MPRILFTLFQQDIINTCYNLRKIAIIIYLKYASSCGKWQFPVYIPIVNLSKF